MKNQLLDDFPVKIIQELRLTIFQCDFESYNLFDNFPVWLSTFFDNFPVWLSALKSSKFWLTIFLFFVLKLVDNFPI